MGEWSFIVQGPYTKRQLSHQCQRVIWNKLLGHLVDISYLQHQNAPRRRHTHRRAEETLEASSRKASSKCGQIIQRAVVNFNEC